MWNIRIGSLFPKLFPGPLGVSCIGKQIDNLWSLEVDDLRQFATDKHKSVDDEPFGGGGGMIIKADVIDAWLNKIKNEAGKSTWPDTSEVGFEEVNKSSETDNNYTKRIIYMSPRGAVFSNQMAKELIKSDLVILCGRYEGVDKRVLEHWNIAEVSIGDFVLHGGEVAAMVVIEACLRYIEGMIKAHSVENESFENNLLEFDQFTRPAEWIPIETKKLYNVPKVLRSGDHSKIEEWRKRNSMKITKSNRPDLWKKYQQQKRLALNADSKKNLPKGGNTK